MESRELRIGNYVKHDGKPKKIFYATISSVAFWIGTDYKDRVMTQNYLYKAIEGIPLTEEILLKCGFEKIGYNYLYYKDIKILTANFGWLVNYKSIDLLEIEFVHQLQNLYFALTGTELEIQL